MSAPKIILYHYSYSPYAHKISYYLTLRALPFSQCPQPPIMPRADLSLLGVTYRRIPVVALDNRILLNTSLILSTLETAFPTGALGGGEAAAEWTRWSDKLFRSAAACIPTGLPAMKNPAFLRDRADFSGGAMNPEVIDANRPRALMGVQMGFEHTEEKLRDGRKWILDGYEVSLADINAVWVLDWMLTLPGALEGSEISAEKYPLTYAWVARFMARMGPVARGTIVSGAEAKEMILAGGGAPGSGEEVKVVPVDTGRSHPQVGRLVRRDADTVTLEVTPPGENRTVLLVVPIEGFEFEKVETGARL
ncbi:hypothetical protein BZA05DRAFT_400169 [Tricharina praecox]|uniref:uncharacterized protein n=1 Tax=Tricharina praecox TaxID=43433 RepID=UPI002220348B|nr:uncharacterized protein BZA05DRAFT_400169 [Tricharina praecox]KAI5850753.1 hypothetical protein BZA05DRAFT_400169 [Tricharina praecox]